MTAESLHTATDLSDRAVQRAIAARLSPLYSRIDLTIPAQRSVANQVVSDMIWRSFEGSAMPVGLIHGVEDSTNQQESKEL